VLSYQGLQLTDDLPVEPKSQICVDAQFDRIAPELLQTRDLRTQGHGTGKIGIGGAPPKSEGSTQGRRRIQGGIDRPSATASSKRRASMIAGSTVST